MYIIERIEWIKCNKNVKILTFNVLFLKYFSIVYPLSYENRKSFQKLMCFGKNFPKSTIICYEFLFFG